MLTKSIMNVYENTKNTNVLVLPQHDQDTSSIVCDLFSSSLSISNTSSDEDKSERDAVGFQRIPIKTKGGEVFDDSSILKDPPPIHEPGYYDHYLFLREFSIGSYNGELGIYHGFNHPFLLIYHDSISPVNGWRPVFLTTKDFEESGPFNLFLSIEKLINQDRDASSIAPSTSSNVVCVYAPEDQINKHPPTTSVLFRSPGTIKVTNTTTLFAESDWFVACYNGIPGIAFKDYPRDVLSVWCHAESLKQAQQVVSSPGKCVFVPVVMLLMGFAHVYEVLVDDVLLYQKESATTCFTHDEQSSPAAFIESLKKSPGCGVVVTPLILKMKVSGAKRNLSRCFCENRGKRHCSAGAISSSAANKRKSHKGDKRLRKKPYSSGAGVAGLVTPSSVVKKAENSHQQGNRKNVVTPYTSVLKGPDLPCGVPDTHSFVTPSSVLKKATAVFPNNKGRVDLLHHGLNENVNIK